MSSISFALRAVAVAAALVLAGQAHASVGKTSAAGKVLSTSKYAGGGSLLESSVPAPASAVVSFDVSGIGSWDAYGSSANEVYYIQLAPFAEVTALGWDVTITTNGTSWLSEAKVAFENSDLSGGVFLTPGVGETFGGTGTYSSGGLLNLADYGLNFNVGADGKLRLEFFEGYVDGELPDAIWNSGSLSIEVSAVPEVSTYAMMALGLVAVGGMVRRRKA